ncbi:hypothetical protein QBC47DRAFT_377562 [Echria macrotheca]|uniref:Mid2 domain-containing protein n=1 Tax=Echria macrotheca TaxID=438768 RepID=A0AAJ0BGD9_9PEZI|nr:hypothetical protein QBC47DRAFT_377562 [Echria macrotheca]
MLAPWNWFRREKRDTGMPTLHSRNENGAFDNPGAGPRQAWRVGEVQNITFNTIFESYNIAIWQQYKTGGGATLGPVVFQLGPNQPKTTSFIWTVQTYKFDLDVSDLFFFWIFNGSDGSTQGRQLPSVSSAYFNILEKKDDTTTSTLSSSSTTSFSSTSSTSSTQSGTSTSIPTVTNLPADTNGTAAATNNGPNNTVPIAVGVSLGVVGVAVLLGLLFWCMKKRKKQAGVVHEVDGGQNNGGGQNSYSNYAYNNPQAVEVYAPGSEAKPWPYYSSETNGYQQQPHAHIGPYAGQDRKVSELRAERDLVEIG